MAVLVVVTVAVSLIRSQATPRFYLSGMYKIRSFMSDEAAHNLLIIFLRGSTIKSVSSLKMSLYLT